MAQDPHCGVPGLPQESVKDLIEVCRGGLRRREPLGLRVIWALTCNGRLVRSSKELGRYSGNAARNARGYIMYNAYAPLQCKHTSHTDAESSRRA
jgi:hypothetical protein